MQKSRANKERIELFIEGLLSGKYEQTNGVLRSVDGKVCALGVAVEVARENGVVCPYYGGSGYSDVGGMFFKTCLPFSIRKWYGFDTAGPTVKYKGNNVTIVALNDEIRLPFDEIATLIKETYINTD